MNVKDMLRQASDAAKQLITLSDQTIIGILKETAQVLRTHTEEVLAANRQDLERMDRQTQTGEPHVRPADRPTIMDAMG